MKKIIVIISVVLYSSIAQGQYYLKDIQTKECHSFFSYDKLFYCQAVEDDVFVIKKNDDSTVIQVEPDTSFRSYLSNGVEMIMIDSIFFSNYDEYAMDIEVFEYYSIQNGNESYLLLHCINGKVYGTFIQPMFIVLKKESGCYRVQSAYMIEDLKDGSVDILDSVMVYFDDRGQLFMTGKNMKMIKHY